MESNFRRNIPRTSHSPGQVAENGALGGIGPRGADSQGGFREAEAGEEAGQDARDTLTSPPGRQRKRELGGGQKAVRVVRQERGCGVGLSTRSGKVGARLPDSSGRSAEKSWNAAG